MRAEDKSAYKLNTLTVIELINSYKSIHYDV